MQKAGCPAGATLDAEIDGESAVGSDLARRIAMTGVADTQAPLEAVLKDEILRMYQAVADQPESTFHFFHGREACA